jgi:hypothetical protein
VVGRYESDSVAWESRRSIAPPGQEGRFWPVLSLVISPPWSYPRCCGAFQH